MFLEDFFKRYFINPIIYGNGYNIVNTIVYGILFGICAILIFKILKKLKIRIDEKLFVSLFPFLILGSVLRVLEDVNIFESKLFVSPFIYILIFLIAFPSLLFSIFLEKKLRIKYHYLLFSISFLILLYFLQFILFKITIEPLLVVISLSFLISFPFLILYYKKKISKINTVIIFAHIFDASTSFTALTFSEKFLEQHVFANLLLSFFGTSSFFLMKIIVIPLVLILIDKNIKNIEEKNFIKFAIFILGFSPGMRNLLLMCVSGL
jgi:uncharacterized membrane protein